jgi:hypothetical protein
MEIITNYLSASCETTNGQVISLTLSAIILGLVLGLIATTRKASR